MDDFEEDDPEEQPGDGFKKAIYLLQLDRERLIRAAKSVSSLGEIACAANTVSRVSAGILSRLPFSPMVSSVPQLTEGRIARSGARDAALRRKWKREFDDQGSSHGRSEQGGVLPVSLAGPTGACADSANVSSDGDEKKALAAERRAVLSSYHAATGHSNKTIYEAATAAGMHSCYKQKFYEWLRGELPSSSQTAQSLVRFLTDRPNFDLGAKKRSRHRR